MYTSAGASPMRADHIDAATPALPWVGRQNRRAPQAAPSATATANPRSLKLPLGLVDSSLTQVPLPSDGARCSGVSPTSSM